MAIDDYFFALFVGILSCFSASVSIAALVVITVILSIASGKPPLLPDLYHNLPAPCYTPTECDSNANSTVTLLCIAVIGGLLYVLVIILSCLANKVRVLCILTIAMCNALVLSMLFFLFHYDLKLFTVLISRDPNIHDRALKYVTKSGHIYFLTLSMTFWLSATVLGGGIVLLRLACKERHQRAIRTRTTEVLEMTSVFTFHHRQLDTRHSPHNISGQFKL